MTGAEEAMKYLEKGKALRERGYFKAACLEFQKAAELEPPSTDLFIEWGQALFENDDYAGAVEKYQKAIILDVKCVDAYKLCGEAFSQLEKYDESAEQYQRAVELDPQDIDALSSLADAWSANDNWKQAIDAYIKVIDGGPGRDVWYQLTKALDNLESNDRSKIVDELERKLRSDVRYAPVFTQWGNALAKSDRYSEAIARYQDAIQLDPKHAYPLLKWGDVLAVDEKYDEAIALYRKASQADPSDTQVYTRWSRALLQQGQYVESLNTYLKSPDALSSDDSWRLLDDFEDGDDSEDLDNWGNFSENPLDDWNDSPLAEIGDAIAKLDNEKSAIALNGLAEALRTANSATLNCLWGDYLAKRRRYLEAVAYYQNAIQLDPKRVNAFLKWGDVLAVQKKYDEAIEQYRKATIADSTSARAYLSLALAFASKKQYVEAVEQYQRAMEIDLTQVDYSKLLDLLDNVSQDTVMRTLDIIQKALTKYADKEQHKKLGHAFFKKKQYEQALAQYEKALRLGEKDITTLHELGQTYERLRDYSKAIESFRQEIFLDPYEESAYEALVRALSSQDRYTEAIEQYKKMLELNPDNSIACFQWGWALYQQEDYEGAIGQYRRVCKIDPQDARAHHYWGIALAAQRRFEEAIEQFQQALHREPETADSDLDEDQDLYLDPYLDWGNALDEQGRRTEAIDTWEKATRLAPNYAYAYHNIANCLWAQGDYQAGRMAWENACEVYERAKDKAKEDGNADLFNYYGSVVREYFSRLEEAEQILQDGLAIDPEHPGIFASLMGLYLERYDIPPIEKPVNHGRYQEQKPSAYWMARESFRKAERILKTKLERNESVDNLQQLGALYLEMGEHDEAKPYYEKALKKDPEAWTTYVGLGVISSRKEDFRQAAQLFENARHRNPNDLNAWSNLAEVYLKLDPNKLRQIEKAEAEYKKILTIAPQHIDALIGLGEVYSAMAAISEKDLSETAIQYYSDAIDLIDAGKGSKRMGVKDRAALHYSRGYARVQYYEASKPLGDEKLLSGALQDFERCCILDRTHHKAERARTKLRDRLSRSSSQKILEGVAPWVVMIPSSFIFAITQTAYFFGMPAKNLEAASYIALTFGALLFFVIGLFLPQIQKLKGAGIELEKVTGTQIGTSGSLGISK